MSSRLALTGPDEPAHATHDGTIALCGAPVHGITERTYPDGANRVCRLCSRAVAAAGSSVPLRLLGGRKRPGGM